MDVYWREQCADDVPPGDAWLSAGERARLAGLRIPKRRADWRLGRWTAKSALSAYWYLPPGPTALAAVELLPAPSGAPQVFFHGRPIPLALSLSHAAGRALCAFAPCFLRLGCDLERVDERSPAFLADFFTAEERSLAERTPPPDRARLVTLLWSAKESALKALGCGLRSDTRWVEALPKGFAEAAGGPWKRLQVTHRNGATFCGWWSESGAMVRTVLAAPSFRRLIALRPSAIPLPARSGAARTNLTSPEGSGWRVPA